MKFNNNLFFLSLAFVWAGACGQNQNYNPKSDLTSKVCNQVNLKKCLENSGGKACYARENCRLSEPMPEGRIYRSSGTAYFPDSSAMEGGFNDRVGKPLRTLQSYLAGNADYVSVAMDINAFAYGTKLRIPELEQKFNRRIEFRVVDTGGAFRGKGTSRIDICVQSARYQHDSTINGRLTLIINESK